MKLYCETPLESLQPTLQFRDHFYLAGSCFSEHIFKKLDQAKIIALNTCHGNVFNPFSIAQSLTEVIEAKHYTQADLFQSKGLWKTWSFHGQFAHTEPDLLLAIINQRIATHHAFLKTAHHLFITPGTAEIFIQKGTQKVVANCHQMPAALFERSLASVDAMVAVFSTLIQKLAVFNPKLRVFFTVSPVRYGTGASRDNTLSKARLHLAIEQLQQHAQHITYFPAYELVIDQARDYRFFEKDGKHPNELAVDWVWQTLVHWGFDPQSQALIAEGEAISKMEQHQLMHPESPQAQLFIEELERRKLAFTNAINS